MHNPVEASGLLHQLALPPAELADDGRGFYLRGLVALRDGDADIAIGLLTQALRRQPGHPGMRRNLVRALLTGRHFDQVVIHANSALAADPNDAEMHFARATALSALGQAAQACPAFARAIALQPNHAPSWLNLGNASADLDDLVSAESLYRSALRLDPALPEAHASLGYVLTMQRRLPEAIDACEAAIRYRPDFSQAHWNLAIALLLSGDLPRGFAEYEWRKRHAPYRQDFSPMPIPEWDGSSLIGKTILVRAEQGLGDAIQFGRYLLAISDAGGTPVLLCNPALVPLFASIPNVTAISSLDEAPPWDVWIDLLSLPLRWGTSIEAIPYPNAYLRADPARVAAWQSRLPDGWNVGLLLAGNPQHSNDRRRSIPPAIVDQLPAIEGVSFVSLQHGPGASRVGLADQTAQMPEFAATAALVQALDLVVTVDTAIAHLAGALGKPTWLLLPAAPDWRWMLHRSDSPWYSSMTIIRQPAPNDWAAVWDAVVQALGRLALVPKDAAGGYVPALPRLDRQASSSATSPSAVRPV